MKKGYLQNRLIPVNLQLFAGGGSGDKTEKATPKKRQDARKKGQVLQSKDIVSSLVLLILFISLKVFGGYIYSEITSYMRNFFTEYPNLLENFDYTHLATLMFQTFFMLVKVLGPVFAVALVGGLIGSYAQVGVLFTTETLGVKFERINPLSGLKRIFSIRGTIELVKSLLKISIIGYVAFDYLRGEISAMLGLMELEVLNIAVYIASTAINIGIRICIAMVLIGVLDYGYQWWQYEKDLKMTKHEIKEEYKQIEGNPEIKGKIKQKQRQMSMRRMMQEVPKADVVITNPTHFAVAIKYDATVSDAPMLLAKGQDYMALRIRELAKENRIEIVENKPLARTLYESVNVGGKIPPELYQAVAEVLAFVYSLKEKGRTG